MNYQTLVINESPVERVGSFRYLGFHITQDLSWSCHINTMVKKARQRLYHLRHLRDYKLPSKREESVVQVAEVLHYLPGLGPALLAVDGLQIKRHFGEMGNCHSSLTSELSSTPVFTNTFYRIPALVHIDGTFLAFAESRTSPRDEHATLLILNRGTWQNGSVQWSGFQELKKTEMDNHRAMNPCPVYDKEKNILFLFFNCISKEISEKDQIDNCKNAAKLCYITSSDKGETWTDLVDLTEHVIGDEIENWATFSVAPGHGIQMKDGRLIVPAYVYYIDSSVKSYAFAFYSDDHGSTWSYGKKLSVTSGECQVAEITSNGKTYLYCNARSSEGYRVEAWSENGGESFDKISCNKSLVEPPTGCQGSVVSFQLESQDTWLLFLHTTDKEKRKDLGVYLNKTPLDPKGWAKPYIINPGCSGYSDLIQIDEIRFACLLEHKTHNHEEIAFVEFTLDDMKSKSEAV
ncbi:hypothetical protein QTP70_015328 [Hemibagrus guttatus]|uniref:exo-alpha-sialidase n=1 Tax=Hemibagrus guttatus TaxID=175788 RepID=A0AAE0PQM2_9TELE|nr:hypothetical protein QTP70_015328 [Hemibagrus guttatus]